VPQSFVVTIIAMPLARHAYAWLDGERRFGWLGLGIDKALRLDSKTMMGFD
jgi:hypothetical protein